MRLKEFAPAGGSGSGNYFKELASAWYNGTFDSGSLQKGIKSQQDVEQLLQRGIIGPDGVTRKYGIDYNSTFDGVVISSDDYYEHADHDETDSRTGKPFGPYDYMEFGDEELDEGLTEVDRRGFLKGLAATAVAGAAGSADADWRKGKEYKDPMDDKIYRSFHNTSTDGYADLDYNADVNTPKFQLRHLGGQFLPQSSYPNGRLRVDNGPVVPINFLIFGNSRTHVGIIASGNNPFGPDTERLENYILSAKQRILLDVTELTRTDQKIISFNIAQQTKESVNQGVAEGLTEFAADDGNDGGEDDALRNYARMWWAGDEATQMQIERALAKMGWEIGEDEGGYDNGGVFVVRAGDENGNSYQSWAAEDLTEDWKSKLAGAALAGAMALGAGGAHARVGADYVDNPDINRLTGKPKVTQVEPGTEQPVAAVKKGPGFSAEYLKSVIDGTHPRPLISKERAQELLQQQQQTTNEQGVAEGNDPWGPEGRFVGDTGPAQITNTVPRVQLRIGDRVLYKPTEQRATIEALSKDGTKARIHIPSPMGGRIFNCRVADLKALGQGLIREKSTSQAQFRTMAAAAHDPKFARKVGIKQSVAREFNKADTGQDYKSLPKRAD